MKLNRIMVAIKPWERALPLAPQHGRLLAQAADAEVELVSSVFDAAIGAGCERGELPALKAQERTVAAARVELERLAGSMREWGARVTTRIVWGAPAYEAILTAAQDWRADLVVVAAHERSTLHARLTDTDWQLMRRARCPLLLVKCPSFSGYRTIVAAVDALPAADEPLGLDRAVLAAGRSVATAFGSVLRAVYAYAGPSALRLASPDRVALRALQGGDNVEALHRRAVIELAAQFGVAADEIDLVARAPARAIVDSAAHRRAELIVVGAAQRSGVAAAVLGNTAELVAGEVPCDVLIVPEPGAAQSAPRARSKVG